MCGANRLVGVMPRALHARKFVQWLVSYEYEELGSRSGMAGISCLNPTWAGKPTDVNIAAQYAAVVQVGDHVGWGPCSSQKGGREGIQFMAGWFLMSFVPCFDSHTSPLRRLAQAHLSDNLGHLQPLDSEYVKCGSTGDCFKLLGAPPLPWGQGARFWA